MSERTVDGDLTVKDYGHWALLYAILALTALSIVLASIFTAFEMGVV